MSSGDCIASPRKPTTVATQEFLSTAACAALGVTNPDREPSHPGYLHVLDGFLPVPARAAKVDVPFLGGGRGDGRLQALGGQLIQAYPFGIGLLAHAYHIVGRGAQGAEHRTHAEGHDDQGDQHLDQRKACAARRMEARAHLTPSTISPTCTWPVAVPVSVALRPTALRSKVSLKLVSSPLEYSIT